VTDAHAIEVLLRSGDAQYIMAEPGETLAAEHEITPKSAQGNTTWIATGDIIVKAGTVELGRFPADFVAAVITHNPPNRVTHE
jgi:hypothetical protein